MKTLQHQYHNVNDVRFSDNKSVDFHTNKHTIDLFCYRHPDKMVQSGCVEQNCQKMLMCTECSRQDPNHQKEHSDTIVDFSTFLNILMQELKNVNRQDSALYNQNVKRVLENDHSYEAEFEKKCKSQVHYFHQHVDDNVSLIIQQFQKLKTNNNLLYFKAQFQQINPEETIGRYSDLSLVISKLLMKTPHQSFQFLNNLRKSANMEGQLLADLDYISKQILTTLQDKQYMIPDFVFSSVKNFTQELIQQTKTMTIDHLKEIPIMDKTDPTHFNAVTSSYLSFGKNHIRLQQQELFDQINNFHFTNVAQIQTHHVNSVSSLVALSDEVAATSSYDRTIKIWNLTTGVLLKTLFDTNCVSCLTVLKITNDKNPQNDTYTDDEIIRLNAKLLENPSNKISDAGLLLISGGFDKIVKVWDFDLIPNNNELAKTAQTSRLNESHRSFTQLGQSLLSNNSSSILSQPYHFSTFPLKQLQGHVSWITALASLEDEKNIVSGDDTGELIIWDAISGTLMFRLAYVRNPCIVPFITVNVPFSQFCCSSGSILRVYTIYYGNLVNQTEEDMTVKERLSAKFLRRKAEPISITPTLQNVYLNREFDIGWQINGCVAPYNYRNEGLLLVYGAQSRKLKYVQIAKNRQIEIQGDWKGYVSHVLLIEKMRIRESQMEQFYKNINLVICSDKEIGLYDGYGNKLRLLESDGADDFYGSNVLCQRNMQILKLARKGQFRMLRMAAVSQFASDYYNYKAARITLFEIKCDFLDYKN